MERFSLRRILSNTPFGIQVLLVLGVVALVVAGLQLGQGSLDDPSRPAATTIQMPDTPVAPTPTMVTPTPATPTPSSRSPSTPTPTLLPPEGGIIYALQPYVNRVGWIASDEPGNHFGDADLYTGFQDGRIYHGAFQFDLSFLNPGSFIHYAALELTARPNQQPVTAGTWSAQVLDTAIDPEWPLHGFDDIHQASTAHTLLPTLSADDLVPDRTYVFQFNAAQRAELEQRIARGVISFRLDGPSFGDNNLFNWHSGYESQPAGTGPILRLAVAPPVRQTTPTVQRIAGLGTPTPTYVIITSVPDAQNLPTAAAQALTATAWATTVGTPTPLPLNWVTPVIVTATPTPENEATVTAQAVMDGAIALLTGTPTPTPGNVWTTTPTPTYIVITLVPTAENLVTAAAEALTATAWATTTGTPTPLPENWVTPIIVTATPTPANQSTVIALDIEATAVAFLTGTPTPTPINLWVVTATPTPLFIYLEDLPAAGTATPTPASPPLSLQGRIAYVSDRRGEHEYYIMSIDGSRVALLTNDWAYQFAAPRQVPGPDGDGYVSADGGYIVYAQGNEGDRQVWIRNIDGSSPHNISDNDFDEYSPLWLAGPTPTPTSTQVLPPTPTPTTAPPRPKPTKPLPGV